MFYAPRLVVAIVAAAAFVASASAQREPDAQQPYTQHDFIRETTEFNHATTTQAYQKVGRRDARWDASAEKFLDSLALYWSASTQVALYVPADTPSFEEIQELGKTALDQGCHDPLVVYCYGRILEEAGLAEEAEALIARAYDGLVASRYPAERIWAVARRRLAMDPPPRERQAVEKIFEDSFLKMLRGPFVNAAHRRNVLAWTMAAMPEMPPAAYQRLHDRIVADEAVDRWIVHVIAGKRHIALAWEARGGGWANQVTQEGWRGFRANLATAEAHLTRAFELHPDHPEAPTHMISVAMGQQGDVRLWFQRAIAAQLDYQDAYDKILWALTPRWSGSYEQMLEVGMAAMRTGRYDTTVPYQFINALQRVCSDSQTSALWTHPDYYRTLTEILGNYARRLTPEQGAHYYRSLHAAIEYRARNVDEARRLLDECGEEVWPHVFTMIGAPKGELSVSQIYARTGPQAEQVERAGRLLALQREAEARDVLREVLGSLPEDDKGRLAAREDFTYADYVTRFQAGEWLDLLPVQDLPAWLAIGGQWWVEDGVLFGAADGRGLLLACAPDFGRRYELTASIEMPADQEAAPVAGLVVDYVTGDSAEDGFWLTGGDKQEAVFRVGNNDPQFKEVPAREAATLRLTAWDGQFTATVNGKPVGTQVRPVRPPTRPWPRLAIGAPHRTNQPGAIVRINELKIRRLIKDPAAAE